MRYLCLILVILLYSCGTYQYYPTYQNFNLSEQKNETQINTFASQVNEGLNVSHSLTDHLGAFVTYNKFNSEFSEKRRRAVDFGAFYYRSMQAQDKLVKYSFTASPFYGYGYDYSEDDYRLKFNRLGFQTSAAFTSKFIDAGLSSRFMKMVYQTEFSSSSFMTYEEVLGDVGLRPFHFSELSGFIGLGYKGVKLNLQIIQAYKLNKGEISMYDNDGYLSLSINLKWSDIFKDRLTKTN